MTRPAVIFLTEDESDLPWMQDLARNVARHLSSGADLHRAAGDHETADALDQAALRFHPALRN